MCKRDAASAASLLSFLYAYNKKNSAKQKKFLFYGILKIRQIYRSFLYFSRSL